MSKELLSDEIDTLTDKIEELEGENSHLTKEVDRLKHKLSLLESDYEELDEKYEEIAGDWCSKAGGFLNAKRMPLAAHEDISVHYKKLPTYNPQKEKGNPYTKKADTNGDGGNYGKFDRAGSVNVNEGTRYPRSVIKIANNSYKSLHPTQKPVKLMEYLIKTYTQENELVLDFTMGSGTTGVACLNTNRRFLGIELDEKYFEIAKKRIEEADND